MYYSKKKLAVSVMWVIIGAALIILECVGTIDSSVYSGMGGALVAVGILQIIKNIRYNTNESYKEKIDIAAGDERNRYIRMKAWAWAGYIFIIGSAITSLILFILGQALIGRIVSFCMCAVLLLYWISYMILQRKY